MTLAIAAYDQPFCKRSSSWRDVWAVSLLAVFMLAVAVATQTPTSEWP